ncbi:MAG: hypothetical protein MUF12_01955 [Sediminibacterium sp.]|jgi:hypothetical protein|nr:hypothetical protein [Sediminibacterium sp.]
MLINNVEEIREYLGRAVNASFEPTSLQPFIRMATDTYLKKAIGAEYLHRIETAINLTNEELELKHLLKRALSLYAYELYLPFALGNDGDGGLHEPENTNTKPLRIGVLEKRQRATAQYSGNAMEAVLEKLFEQKNDFQVFWDSDFGKELNKYWFRNTKEIQIIFPQLNINYRLLITLNPYFVNITDSTLRDLIGDELLAFVKDYHKTPTSPTNLTHQNLYNHVRKFIAIAGYEESLVFLQFVQTEKGIRVYSEFDGINNSKAPEKEQWAEYKRSIETLKQSAKNTLLGFLSQNTDTFTSFKSSVLYKGNTSRMPDNSKRKSIFRMR